MLFAPSQVSVFLQKKAWRTSIPSCRVCMWVCRLLWQEEGKVEWQLRFTTWQVLFVCLCVCVCVCVCVYVQQVQKDYAQHLIWQLGLTTEMRYVEICQNVRCYSTSLFFVLSNFDKLPSNKLPLSKTSNRAISNREKTWIRK
jgi:hypothetical protein